MLNGWTELEKKHFKKKPSPYNSRKRRRLFYGGFIVLLSQHGPEDGVEDCRQHVPDSDFCHVKQICADAHDQKAA